MLADEALQDALVHLPITPVDGWCYKATHFKYLQAAAPALLYAMGAPLHGGRFTPRGGMPSLYLAEDPETALGECNQIRQGLMALSGVDTSVLGQPLQPTVVYSVRVRLRAVLDVTNSDVQVALGTRRDELRAAWRHLTSGSNLPPTQQLGMAAYASGRYTAIRYESALFEGHFCLDIFTDSVMMPGIVEVNDPDTGMHDRLPRP